jgi:hypothetical protein
MSVLLPWTRKRGREGPGIRAGRPVPASNRPKASLLSMLFTLLGIVALLLTAREALFEGTLARMLPEGSKVWEASSLEHSGGLYAVAYENGRAFYGPLGKIVSLPDGTEEAVISGGKAYAIAGTSIHGYGPDGKMFLTQVKEPGENLLPCKGLSGILVVRPGGGGFGEPWVLRAVFDGGEVSPPVRLPGIPAEAAAEDGLLYVGLRDIASGGAALLTCAEVSSGKVLWCLPLGDGHFRSIIPLSSGRVFYATSKSAGVVGPGGGITCSLNLGGPVWTAAWEDETAFISHGLISEPFVTAFAEDGKLVWQRRTPSVAHRLVASDHALVALCQTHVVGFSLRDGRREYSFKTRDLPLAVGEGSILFGNDKGAYLMSLDINLSRLP